MADRPWYNQPVLLVQPAQPVMPIIVKVVAAPTKEISVADILVDSVGITGLFLLGAALLGFVVGGMLILIRRWQAAHDVGGRETRFSSHNRRARSHNRARLSPVSRTWEP
jgi:hypothetical protein